MNNEDLISRQAAIDIFDDYNIAVENGEIESYRRYREQLSCLPSVQPKTGRWKHVEIESNKSDTGYFMLPLCKCSVCEIYVEQESNYCPNCGADMRSKAREYLEYGELITKGIAQGLRGDSDE